MIPPAIKRFSRNSLYEFQAPSAILASHMEDLGTYWSIRTRSKRDLIETGKELSRLNALYRIQAGETTALRNYNLRLQELLKIPSPPDFRYEVAQVVRRDLSNWWQQLIIRKGRDAGIVPGAGVVFAGGVVGRVREVHAYTSTVDLLSSRTFRMAAHFSGDTRPVRYEGSQVPSLRNPKGTVRDVPSDLYASPEEPLVLVSSRLGGVFPDGLRIGEVRFLETDSSGLFQRGIVQLSEDLLNLNEVSVLIPAGPAAKEIFNEAP
ncbi:rod shape-determining protein MreC [Puniceicoccus vermicola]|uniref:Cell shape-determining protein MreC n=1 Tax=Puniceicoccus vermicola TaxID=388746 RepID=A0A7X1AWZ5_9BACT|nr:rod shape-determining protein MreC [Puniceicoccus vermicola]